MDRSFAQHLLLVMAFIAAFAGLMMWIVSLGEVPSEGRLIVELILALPLLLYGFAYRRRWQR